MYPTYVCVYVYIYTHTHTFDHPLAPHLVLPLLLALLCQLEDILWPCLYPGA